MVHLEQINWRMQKELKILQKTIIFYASQKVLKDL